MRKAKIRIILGDKLMIWYPYVQMKKMKTPYKIVDAEGVYLYTQDNKMIDSVSSWWCMIHGYKNKEILFFFRFGFGCCRGCLENGIAI